MKEDGYLCIHLPRVEVTGSHGSALKACKDAARAILPRLSSFKRVRLKILVPYTCISEPEDYYVDNPMDDRYGWHHSKGGVKSSGAEVFYPLHLAASEGLKHITNMLLENQTDVNAKGDKYETPASGGG